VYLGKRGKKMAALKDEKREEAEDTLKERKSETSNDWAMHARGNFATPF